MVSFAIPQHKKTAIEIKEIWGELKEYVIVEHTANIIEEYITNLYNPVVDYKKLNVQSKSDINTIKNLLEAVMLMMSQLIVDKKIDKNEPFNIISSNFNIIAENMLFCAAGKIEELNSVYKILKNDFTEKIATLESFVEDFIIQEKIKTFDMIISSVSDSQNVHVKQFWEFRLRHKLGFSNNYRSGYGSLQQDPFRAHTGNVLNAFYKRFTVESVVNALTMAINDNNEIKNMLLYYLNELSDCTHQEKMTMVECPINDELENAIAVKPKAILTYLINNQIVLKRKPKMGLLKYFFS